MMLGLLLLALIGCTSAEIASVTYDGSNYEIHMGVIMPDWVAQANFTDNTFEEGFAYLELKSNKDYNDTVQAYAAGLAEGATTHEMIYNAYRNTIEGYCDNSSPDHCVRVRQFLDDNRQWLDSKIPEKRGTCEVMHTSGLILSQLDGLNEGYRRKAENPIEEDAILMMNLMGDLDDLEEALNPEVRNMTLEEWVEAGHTPRDGRCSALIKVLPQFADIYVSQVTWNKYAAMLRILKLYNLPFRQTGNSSSDDINPGYITSFSSYPGMLFSGDDLHILSSGLVAMETTIGNSNPELWQFVEPERQILEWMRTIIANRVSKDGADWVHFFSKHNSGTYNNQWMIIDYKLFEPGTAIKPNTLWVLEQLPNNIESADKSDLLLLQSYFASYNAPYFENIFNLSGSQAMVDKYGDWFSYDKTPRALMFERDHSSVKDMDSMFKLMRYNDYQNDPLARCDCIPPYSGENGISARSDLNPSNGTYPFSALAHRLHGGTDAKVTNYEMMQSYKFLAVNGPTYDQVPVFKWSELGPEDAVPHYGHPDEWKFSVVEHEWVW